MKIVLASIMFIFFVGLSYGGTTTTAVYESIVTSTTTEIYLSPNKKIELVSMRTEDDYPVKYGNRLVLANSILFLRFKNAVNGIYLGNYKYFNANWSADSKYIAIEKCYSTHNSDIDIYRVVTNNTSYIRIELIYQNNALFLPVGENWVNWKFVKWDRNSVVIRQNDESHSPKNSGSITYTVPLASKALISYEFRQDVIAAQPGVPVRAQYEPDE